MTHPFHWLVAFDAVSVNALITLNGTPVGPFFVSVTGRGLTVVVFFGWLLGALEVDAPLPSAFFGVFAGVLGLEAFFGVFAGSFFGDFAGVFLGVLAVSFFAGVFFGVLAGAFFGVLGLREMKLLDEVEIVNKKKQYRSL